MAVLALFFGQGRYFQLSAAILSWGLLVLWLLVLAVQGWRSSRSIPVKVTAASLTAALAKSSTMLCSVHSNGAIRFRYQGEISEGLIADYLKIMPELSADINRARQNEPFMAFYSFEERSYRVHFQRALSEPEVINLVFVDVTHEQEKTTEMELSNKIFNNTSDAVIVTDDRRRIYSVNHEFSVITGFTEDDVRGKRLGFPKTTENRFAFYREIITYLRADGCWRGDVWSKRKNGEVFSGRMKVTVNRGRDGKIKDYIAFFSDITELRKSEEELRYLAHHDVLTGLPNRRLFFDRIDQAIKRARRSNGQFAIYFVDLDNFKSINDDLGHPAGDELLKMVANRLLKVVRESDTVARLAGDEFTIVAEEVDSLDEIKSIAEKIVRSFDPVFQLGESEVYASASVGVGVYPTDGDDMMQLIKGADSAMYKAKMKRGVGSYFLLNSALDEDPETNEFFVSELRHALERDQLQVVYQPQVLLHSGEVVGCEALLRWQHEQFGQVRPHHFMPIAEEEGIFSEMEYWVLQQVCEQMVYWLEQNLPVQFVTLNVSKSQLDGDVFVEKIKETLQQTGLSPKHLIVEVSEASLLNNMDKGTKFIQQLRDIGVATTVDDFGSTRSEFGYLKGLPVSGIKIDNQHLQNIKRGQQGDMLVRAMVGMGEILDIDVVAEGIERGMQEHYLQAIGCRLGQGYLYGKPMTAESFQRLFNHIPEVDLT